MTHYLNDSLECRAPFVRMMKDRALRAYLALHKVFDRTSHWSEGQKRRGGQTVHTCAHKTANWKQAKHAVVPQNLNVTLRAAACNRETYRPPRPSTVDAKMSFCVMSYHMSLCLTIIVNTMAAPQHAGRPAAVPIWIHRMRSGFDRYVATIMDNHRWSWSKFSVNIEAGIDILKRSETATRTATRTESSCYQALPRPDSSDHR